MDITELLSQSYQEFKHMWIYTCIHGHLCIWYAYVRAKERSFGNIFH